MEPLTAVCSERLLRVASAMGAPDPAGLDAALHQLDRDDWSTLEQVLGTAAARSVQGTRSSSTKQQIGDVILLPGIMGTDLAVRDPIDGAHALWFDPLDLAAGGLERLRLPVDGSAPLEDVVIGGPLELFFLPLQMQLNQRWRTRLFPYDWRHDIARTADRLASELASLDGPIHLVAHSMGGLVCRAMVARHPQTWARAGGRLVMLGTPNRGTFAPVLALTGKDRKLRLLALLDPKLGASDIGSIVGTFPGLIQMLPSVEAGIDPPVDPLYVESSWPDAPVAQAVLDRARRTHHELAPAVDPDRMVNIVGYGQPTIDGVDVKDGWFRFRRRVSGDGTVPHALATLPGVPTYWTRLKHGLLAKDVSVIHAVTELLSTGATQHLLYGRTPPDDHGELDERWADSSDLDAEVDDAISRAHATGRDISTLDDVLPITTSANSVQVPLQIEVVWGGIGDVTADVIAVGHYQHVYPTAAELALDEAISGCKEDRRRLLHAATARGALKGTLGDVFIVPWDREDGRRVSAMVLGLGRPGTFKLPQHEVLVRNLVWSAERVLKASSAACVLIGAGAKNLTIDAAVDSILRSLDAAVRESELTGSLRILRIVEVDLGRARRILDAFRRAVDARDRSTDPAVIDLTLELQEEPGGIVSLETALGSVLEDVRSEESTALGERLDRAESSPAVRAAMLQAIADRATEPGVRYLVTREHGELAQGVPTRLSLLEIDGKLIGSAVSDAATVAERDFGLDVEIFTQLVELANSQAAGNPTLAGQMLLRVAIRPEFRPLLELDRDVVVEVDRTTAALPWEVLGTDASSPGRLAPLGLRTPLARQLRTRQSPPPAVTGRVVLTRALIIGDPGGPGGRLPGAEREAMAVAQALHDRDIEFDFLLGPHGATETAQRWQASPATVANVLHHLLHEEYQLVHYAGHGTFSADSSDRATGWLLADGLLTGTHLTIIERLPPLVVANACHSSRLSTDLPGLADEFMSRGVRNLVGTARTVNDESARRFTDHFYACLLESGLDRDHGPSLGNAVLAGRRHLADHNLSDWDVYQLYGDPSFRFWPDVLGRGC